MRPTVSIALGTYNGARYLPALLDSLADQELLPGELIAFDDASGDDTVAILESFALSAPFTVRVFRNPLRLGVEENFSRCIAACQGDYIALADQDDIWHSDKLALLAQVLAAPDVLAAFSDAEVVDANLNPLGYTMWQRVKFSRSEQDHLAQGQGFAVLLKHRVVTGATLAFKTALRDSALPIVPGWQHDAWFALLAAAQGKLLSIRRTLIAYRQHDNNVVGGIRPPLRQQIHAALSVDRNQWYSEELVLWRGLALRLNESSASATACAALSEKIAHLETRAQLPANRWQRLPGVLREIAAGGYSRYARNWGSIALDLLLK